MKAAAAFKKGQRAVRAPDKVQLIIDKVRAEASEARLSLAIIEKIYRTMINAFIDNKLEPHQKLVNRIESDEYHFSDLWIGSSKLQAARLMSNVFINSSYASGHSPIEEDSVF